MSTIHVVSPASNTPKMAFNTELLLYSLKKYSGFDNVYLTVYVDGPVFSVKNVEVINYGDWLKDTYLRWLISPKSDVVVFMDVDTFVTGELVSLVDLCHNKQVVFGCNAHFAPSPNIEWQVFTETDSWVVYPGDAYNYLWQKNGYVDDNVPLKATCPQYYFNSGVLFVPQNHLYTLRNNINLIKQIHDFTFSKIDYFSTQIAEMMMFDALNIPREIMSIKYNCPTSIEALNYCNNPDIRIVHLIGNQFTKKEDIAGNSTLIKLVASKL